MACLFLNSVTENEISLLLNGQASDDLKRHIERCPACRKRVEDTGHLERYLKTSLLRSDCPGSQMLGNYHAGLLDRPEQKIIEAHLKLCSSCHSELQILIDFLEADIHDVQPKADTKSQPANIIRPYKEYFKAASEPMPMRKVRGKSKRQIRAVANGIELLFELQHSTEGIAIEGLLVPLDKEDTPNWIGSLVEIRSDGTLLTVCYIDDMGTFRCDPVPAGVVLVRITSPKGQSIVISDVEITL